jgi:hypothetical protein
VLAPNNTSTSTASTASTAPTEDDEHLAALAKRVRTEHEAAQTATRNAVAHALNAGDALIRAKEAIPNKRWLRWLQANCSLSVRTAQLYMRLAEYRTEIEHKLAGAPDFSIRAAQRLIAKPKATKPKTTTPKPATTGKRTTASAPGAPAPVPADIATARLGETVSRLLWQALGQLELGQQPKALTALKGMLAKLRTQGLEFHDIAVVVQRHASSRPRVHRRRD